MVLSNKPRLLQIADEHRGGLIYRGTDATQAVANIAVVVPAAGADGHHHLDEADAGFHEAAGHEAARAEVGGDWIVQTVQPAHGDRLARQIEQALGVQLHAGGKLVIPNAPFQLGFIGEELAAFFVEADQGIEIGLLNAGGERRGGMQIEYGRSARLNLRAPELSRQPAAFP